MRQIGCALSSPFEFHTSKMKIPNETNNAFQNRDLAAKGHIANVQVRFRYPRSLFALFRWAEAVGAWVLLAGY